MYVAQMLGVMHTLQAEKLHNTDFLKGHTVGWPQVEEYLIAVLGGHAEFERVLIKASTGDGRRRSHGPTANADAAPAA
jgi:hypothetical protein